MVSQVHEQVQTYLQRLQTDLARIEDSQVTEDQKAEARQLARELSSRLEHSSAIAAVAGLGLGSLIVRFNTILGVVVGDPLGACIIGDKCLQTTKAHCDDLGGKWELGVPCPG